MRVLMIAARVPSARLVLAGMVIATSASPGQGQEAALVPPVAAAVRVGTDESSNAADTAKQVTVIAPADGAPKRITIRVVGDVATVVDAAAAGAAEAGAARARKLVPFIGVATSPLAAAVRAQTGLPEDVGLAVDAVTPDSPAAAAGLVPFDVLAKYDDQILCAAVQLLALVKRTGTGNTATLTVLRGGKELTVPVKIGEREADVTMQMVTGPGMGMPGGGAGAGMAIANLVPGQPLDPKLLERLAREAAMGAGGMLQGQVQGFVPLPGGAPGIVPPAVVPVPPVAPVPVPNANQRWLFINPNAPPAATVAPGAPGAVQTQSQSIAVFSSGEGRVELRNVNGKKTVSVFGADGKEQYAGPYDTDADKAKVPEALRDRVEKAAAASDGVRVDPAPATGKPAKKISL